MGVLDPIAPGSERLWLLDVDLGGRVERFATRAVEVPRADGSVLSYRAGLGELRMTLTDSSSATLSKAIEIDAEPEGASWAQLSAEGLEADRRPGVLYRWTPGDELERARVVLRGFFFAVKFDREGEGLEATLARVPFDSTRTIPEGEAVVTDQTWPVRLTPQPFETDDRILGAHYPRVYGYPGTPRDGASPALLVEFRLGNPNRQESFCVIAGGRVDAETVRLFDYDEPDSRPMFYDRPVLEKVDKLGRLVSGVDALGLSFATFHFRPGRSYYVTWRNLAGFGGGIQRTDRSGPIRGWAEIVLDLLSFTDLTIDRANFASEAATLNRWKLDGVINSPAGAWDVIERELLPLVPARLVEGPAGIYFRVMRWEAGPELATHRLDARAAGVERLSLGARPIESVRNRFVLDYRPDRLTGKHKRRLTLDAAPIPGDEQSRASYRCLRSQQRFELVGRPGSGVFTEHLATDWIEQDATARRALETLASRFALPPRPATYQLPPQWEDEIEIGDVVTVTDPEVFLADRVALVDNVEIGGGELVVDLLLLEDPARLDRLVP